MNPWYEKLVDDCLAEHDRVCLDGAECPERETHTMEAYVAVALRERVETLQGQMDQAEVRIKAVEDLHQALPNSCSALYPSPLCSCGKDYPCPTIRALDG